ncbi:MAG: protein kinase, partial [Acidobacteria bacterium]|nr:protein kinase [Acidobacteriota bacterium]
MIGQTLLHYRIIEKLGEGGMGVVYKARDLHLDRFVAIKILPPEVTSDPERRRRFVLEAKAASALNHPGIIVIHDIDEARGVHFIAMEYVSGRTLDRVMKEGPMPLPRSLGYAAGIAEALAAAHAAGIVHRDLKPSNVMVTWEDRVKVFDFGLAKLSGGTGGGAAATEEVTRTLVTATGPGTVMGTLSYMSPEQARGQALDYRTDIFSLGVVAYHLVSGRLPFRGPNALSVLEQILHAPAPPLRDTCPGAPEEVEKTIDRAMAKNPEERFRDMHEMAAALRSLEEAAEKPRAVAARQADASRAGMGRFLRRPALAACIALLALLFVSPFRARVGPEGPEARVPSKIRMAILPLLNIGARPESQEIADGLVEILAAKFARIAQYHGNLSVISPADIRAEGITGAAEARRAFGVNLVLCGSVQVFGSLVRVTIYCVDAVSLRQTGADSCSASVFEMMGMDEEIFDKALAMLGLDLKPEARRLVEAGRTRVSGAYALYLPAEGLLSRHDMPENLDRAIELFKKALSEDPQYALAHAGLGEAYYWKFRASPGPEWARMALTSCQAAQAIDDRLARVYITRSMLHTELGRPEQAVRELSSAIAIEPANAEVHRELGRAYESLGKGGEAEGSFRKAIELAPDSWSCHWELAVFLYRHSRYEESAGEFLEVTRLFPNHFRAYSSLGGIRIHQGRFVEAERVLRKSLEIRPTMQARVNLAAAYILQGRAAEAVPVLEQAAGMKGAPHQVWGNLGDACVLTPGMERKARPAYEYAAKLAAEYLKLKPSDGVERATLAFYLVRLGERERALAEIGRALETAPGDARVLFWAALVHEEAGERDRALELLAGAVAGGYSRAIVEATS